MIFRVVIGVELESHDEWLIEDLMVAERYRVMMDTATRNASANVRLAEKASPKRTKGSVRKW
jgi:hypothetical protein